VTKVLTVGLSVAAMIAAPACSCSDSVDKAAKERIFSPEDPPKVVASAAEKLSPEELADNPAIARRVLRMGAAEATERLGPHRYNASVKLEWSASEREGSGLELLETRTLIAGPGGVNGNFHGTVQNSRDQGLEVIRVGGEVYARSRYGKFRQRLRDRGMAEREREDLFGALRDIDDLFQGRLKLEQKGTVAHDGRTAWRYAVSLAAANEALEPAQQLPPRSEPKGGIDPSTQRRLLFFEKREPSALSGEMLVDTETSVVVKAKLEGKLTVPPQQDEKPATVRTLVDFSITGIGASKEIKPPEEYLPDADKPRGIAVTLDRFGIPPGTAAADGGTRPLLSGKVQPGASGKPSEREAEQEKEPPDSEAEPEG
jgi:hypothetical protein